MRSKSRLGDAGGAGWTTGTVMDREIYSCLKAILLPFLPSGPGNRFPGSLGLQLLLLNTKLECGKIFMC